MVLFELVVCYRYSIDKEEVSGRNHICRSRTLEGHLEQDKKTSLGQSRKYVFMRENNVRGCTWD